MRGTPPHAATSSLGQLARLVGARAIGLLLRWKVVARLAKPLLEEVGNITRVGSCEPAHLVPAGTSLGSLFAPLPRPGRPLLPAKLGGPTCDA